MTTIGARCGSAGGGARPILIALILLLAGCSGSMTPLHEAARSGDSEVVRTYIREKRNLDPRWNEPTSGLEGNYARLNGLTPLMLAAQYGQLEVATLLVDGGADLYAEANTRLPGEPLTAFDFAVQGNHLEIAEYLWKKSDGARLGRRLADQIAAACNDSCHEGAGTDAGSNLALFLISVASAEAAGAGVGMAACYSRQPLELMSFVEKHAARPPRNTLHCLSSEKGRPYHPLAVRLAVLTWMLDHGADVNGLVHGWTPLMDAAIAHELGIAKLLVARGANPNLGGTYLPPIAAAANTCVHATSATAVNPDTDAQLAMVQFLAPLSDRRVYASPAVLKQAYLIGQCCAGQPQTASQRQICDVFGR